jgi:ABC-type glycerol-3-phosphate transport system substrate-binding protein
MVAAVLTAALASGVAACGGSGTKTTTDPERTRQTIGVWILEDEPARVRATRAELALFTRRTGIRVRLRAVGEDDLAGAVERARRSRALPDALQLPLAAVHAYAGAGLLDGGAAAEVIRRLGDGTFSQTALSLVSRDGSPAAVPSDGWGQLLVYRKDLFARAGLAAPRTLADVRRAARRLHRPGRVAGIAIPTAPGETFTAQTFEHVALAGGCRLVDDQGRVRLDSAACRRVFALYTELAVRWSPGGRQDVDTTRAAYFAGRAAMIFWSPFLLDAMAGLRADAAPTCPQCAADPAFLARNSGLVGALDDGDDATPPAQFGELSSWGITTGARTAAASRFVEYMLSGGYLSWLALSPQGKYPVRTGDAADPDRFATAWTHLQSGVERRAPLARFYGGASIDALGDGVRSFQRWGFVQGQAGLMGALRDQSAITRPLARAAAGAIAPDAAAAQAQAAVAAVAAGGG